MIHKPTPAVRRWPLREIMERFESQGLWYERLAPCGHVVEMTSNMRMDAEQRRCEKCFEERSR